MAAETIERIRTSAGDKKLDFEGLANFPSVTNIDENSDDNHFPTAKAVMKGIYAHAPRLIKKITVEEDVASVTVSTDEEGNPFALSDFEVRFAGKHSTTMWIHLNRGEKYFSTNQVANNAGLPCFNKLTDYSVQNVIERYIFSGSNYYGIRYQQEIGALGDDGKYATGNGEITTFSTTPVDSLATSIKLISISSGVINAGSIIEIWGY